MNKIYKLISILFLLGYVTLVSAQDVEKYISQANSAYASGQLDVSRNAIQDALRELDIKIGNEIIAMLPATINGMGSSANQDNITDASTGMVGLMVNREWTRETESLDFSIMGNSPLLTGINAMLAMPMMLGANANQKKITVEGYKALFEKRIDENNQVQGYNLMVPVNNSLIQFEYSGTASENDFMNMVGQVPIRNILALVQ
jgi:hypothetical protein